MARKKMFRLIRIEKSGKRRIENVGFKEKLLSIKKLKEKTAKTSRFKLEKSPFF